MYTVPHFRFTCGEKFVFMLQVKWYIQLLMIIKSKFVFVFKILANFLNVNQNGLFLNVMILQEYYLSILLNVMHKSILKMILVILAIDNLTQGYIHIVISNLVLFYYFEETNHIYYIGDLIYQVQNMKQIILWKC
jgi:hypothetical protein